MIWLPVKLMLAIDGGGGRGAGETVRSIFPAASTSVPVYPAGNGANENPAKGSVPV